jgi:hypothetical protein
VSGFYLQEDITDMPLSVYNSSKATRSHSKHGFIEYAELKWVTEILISQEEVVARGCLP